jgi:hypothetical protein
MTLHSRLHPSFDLAFFFRTRIRITLLKAFPQQAIYIVFDMLTGRESLLEHPFRQRRETLERFFRTARPIHRQSTCLPALAISKQ